MHWRKWGHAPCPRTPAHERAADSGEVSKKLFKKHAEELTSMLADEPVPAAESESTSLRAEVLGDRAVAIISAPLDLSVARELVSVGRAGSRGVALVAAQVAEAILKEHALRSETGGPATATAGSDPVAVAA